METLYIILAIYTIVGLMTWIFTLARSQDPFEKNPDRYYNSALGIGFLWPIFLIRAIYRSVKFAWHD